ncbi:MAG: YHS domain-containing (seleno)protein [Paracoccaceae bacterium]
MKNVSKTLLLVAALAVTSVAALPAFAYDENSTSAVNVDASGVGIKGFDPVSYHSLGVPLEGSAEYTASYEGVTYQFASAANRDRFNANPGAYAPAYGGFCQTGAAITKKLDIDPNAWRIADGVLYLYISEAAKETFMKDHDNMTEAANSIWPTIRDAKPADL